MNIVFIIAYFKLWKERRKKMNEYVKQNPFLFFKQPVDIQIFVEEYLNQENYLIVGKYLTEIGVWNFVPLTNPDPFSDRAAKTWIKAICCAVQFLYAGQKECNLNTVMDWSVLDRRKLNQFFDKIQDEMQIRKKEKSLENLQFGQLALDYYKSIRMGSDSLFTSIEYAGSEYLFLSYPPALELILRKYISDQEQKIRHKLNYLEGKNGEGFGICL